jgi:hypothetical protein
LTVRLLHRYVLSSSINILSITAVAQLFYVFIHQLISYPTRKVMETCAPPHTYIWACASRGHLDTVKNCFISQGHSTDCHEGLWTPPPPPLVSQASLLFLGSTTRKQMGSWSLEGSHKKDCC